MKKKKHEQNMKKNGLMFSFLTSVVESTVSSSRLSTASVGMVS